MELPFTPKNSSLETARESCERAIEYAQAVFAVQLDLSEDSINLVEEILETIHQEYLGGQRDDFSAETMAYMFGSYVGEVFRRNYGGNWGSMRNGEEEYETFLSGGKLEFYPPQKVFNRIVNGDEDNIQMYFGAIVEREKANTSA